MMMKNQSKKCARYRAFAIVPAVAVALSVSNLPAVASALSALGCAELSLSETADKGSEKSSMTEGSTKKSTKIVVAGDSLNRQIKTVCIKGGDATDAEATVATSNTQIETVKVHRGIQVGDLDGAEITIDGKTATAAQVEALPEECKKNAYVAVTSDGHKKVKISTKSNPNEYAVFYYVNGKEADKAEIDSINMEQIMSMEIDKTDSQKTKVYVVKSN